MVTTDNTFVPSLRFPDFSGDWEKTNFGSLYPAIRNGFVGTATPFYVSDGVRYLQGKNIKKGRIDEKGMVFINSRFHQKNVKSQLKLNDIVMVQSGHVGECAVIDESYVGANCHALIVMTPNENVTSLFYVFYFSSVYGKKSIQIIKTGNTIAHILASDMKVLEVPFTHKLEQQKIASFLTSVDTKIQQLKRKYTLMQQYKKGVVQQIFSQQVRFKNDDGKDYPDWKEQRLGDLFERVTRKNKKDCKNVMTISGQQGLINQQEYFKKSVSAADVTGYYLMNKDEFAYNKSYSAGYPLGAIKKLNRYDEGVVSTLYICFKAKENIVPEFYEQYFEGGLLNREIQKIAQEGARNHGLLNVSVVEFFRDVVVQLPSVGEQQKISDFLKSIDNKTEQINTQITQAEIFKKGLLQQMFV